MAEENSCARCGRSLPRSLAGRGSGRKLCLRCRREEAAEKKAQQAGGTGEPVQKPVEKTPPVQSAPPAPKPSVQPPAPPPAKPPAQSPPKPPDQQAAGQLKKPSVQKPVRPPDAAPPQQKKPAAGKPAPLKQPPLQKKPPAAPGKKPLQRTPVSPTRSKGPVQQGARKQKQQTGQPPAQRRRPAAGGQPRRQVRRAPAEGRQGAAKTPSVSSRRRGKGNAVRQGEARQAPAAASQQRRRRRPARKTAETAPDGSRKKLLLWGGVSAAAAVVLVVAFVLMTGGGGNEQAEEQTGSGNTSTTTAGKGAKESTAAELAKQQEQERLKAAQREELLQEFAQCEKEEAAHPREFSFLELRYYMLLRRCGGFDSLKVRAERKLQDIQRMHKEEGTKTWDALLEKWNEMVNDEEQGYRAALTLFDPMPPEINGLSQVEDRFLEKKKETAALAEKELYLEELKKEAFAYAEKELYEVAETIIREGFSDNDFEKSDVLWKQREELVQQFKAAPMREFLRKKHLAEQKREEAVLAKAKEELDARKESFVTVKEQLEPKPLLGPYDLINWPLRSRRRKWQLDEVDGIGVLTAQPKEGGGNWSLGQFGPDWEDYSLHFKVKVSKGKVVFYPRLNFRDVRAGRTIRSIPSTDDLSNKIEFSAEKYGTELLDVHVDVYGSGDETVVDLSIEGGSEPGGTTLKGRDLKSEDSQGSYPSAGSFIFVFWEGSDVQLKDVQLQLVRRKRKGILDA